MGCKSVQISSGLCQFFEARGQSKCLPSGERKGILLVGMWTESFEKTEVCRPPIVAKARALAPVRAPCTCRHLREAFPGSPLNFHCHCPSARLLLLTVTSRHLAHLFIYLFVTQ